MKENEQLFRIKVEDLLTVDGIRLPPAKVYRKIIPVQAAIFDRDLTDDDDFYAAPKLRLKLIVAEAYFTNITPLKKYVD